MFLVYISYFYIIYHIVKVGLTNHFEYRGLKIVKVNWPITLFEKTVKVAQSEVTTHFVWKDCQSRALWIDNSLCLRLLVTERKVVWPPTLVGPRGQQNEDTKTRRLKDTWIPIRDHYYCLLTLFTLFWNLIWPAPKDVTYIKFFCYWLKTLRTSITWDLPKDITYISRLFIHIAYCLSANFLVKNATRKKENFL